MKQGRGDEETVKSFTTDRAFAVALEAAIQATQLCLKYWNNARNDLFDPTMINDLFEKDGIGNYATMADKRSENLIVDLIREETVLHDHSILSEESDAVSGSEDWLWVIDPIDGTLPFNNGLPEFGICIGLLKKKEPVLGVIAIPVERKIITAQKGQGVHIYSMERKVVAAIESEDGSQPIRMDRALVAYDLGYQHRSEQMATISRLSDKVGYLICYGSAAVACSRLAEGSLAAYLHLTPTKFDIAAASAIIQELGGVVTDIHGKPLDWRANNLTFLAARNTDIHRKLLEAISMSWE